MSLVLHSQPWDVNRRLAELGLEEEPLRIAVSRGYLGWASCTENHPRIYAPLVAWAETVGAMREYLTTLGWENSDDNNYSLSLSPDGRLAIGVATGNEETGRIAGSPSTTASKGRNTVTAILVNQGQLKLFPEEPQADPGASEKLADRTTWMLLIRRDREEIRCELSLPVSIDGEMRIDTWRERIILRSIPRDPTPLSEPLPQQPDLDINVKRRA